MTEVTTPQTDRRVQRTRQLLHDALTALIMEKRYESITVQDIIDRANLGRSTFYVHYQDKDDLLLSGMEGLVHSLVDGIEFISDGEGEGLKTGNLKLLSALPLFQQAASQSKLYGSIIGRRGIELLKHQIQDHLSQHIQENIEARLVDGQTSSVPPHVFANYLAGALLNLVGWWLDNEMPYSAHEMNSMFQLMASSGTTIIHKV